MAPRTETDILIATAVWLHKERWTIASVSPPGGKQPEGGKMAVRKRIETAFAERGIKTEPREGFGGRPYYVVRGPDIVAGKDSDTWKIECKGRGKGTPQALRNNLDRALASAVSYYDKDEYLRVGLALPAGNTEANYLRARVSSALRRRLNLWVFIVRGYDPERDVDAIPPGEDIPVHRQSY